MLLLYNVGVFVPGSNTFYCLVMENLRSRRGKSNKEMMFLQLKSKTIIFMDWVANWWSRYGFSSASTNGLHGLVNFSKSECLSRPLFHNLFLLNRQFLPYYSWNKAFIIQLNLHYILRNCLCWSVWPDWAISPNLVTLFRTFHKVNKMMINILY